MGGFPSYLLLLELQLLKICYFGRIINAESVHMLMIVIQKAVYYVQIHLIARWKVDLYITENKYYIERESYSQSSSNPVPS